MRRHPALTVRILERVGAFRDLARPRAPTTSGSTAAATTSA